MRRRSGGRPRRCRAATWRRTWPASRPRLPRLEPRVGHGVCHADARIYGHAVVGERDHRVQVELGDLREVLVRARRGGRRGRRGRPCRPRVGRGSRRRGRRPCPTSTSSWASTSVSRERCERRAPDQLGHRAARAERDDGPEHRVLHDSRQELDPCRRPSAGAPPGSRRGPRAASSAAMSPMPRITPPRSTLCTPASPSLTASG